MLASSHAGWTYGLLGDRRHRFVTSVGAVVPDLTAIALAFRELAAGTSRSELLDRVYHRSPWREVHMAAHAALPALALYGRSPHGSARRALAAGWLGHLVVDLGSHSDDAWPPLWPLSEWRVHSPVSHWQGEHHSREFAIADAGGLLVLLVRRPSLIVAGAALAATAALLQQLRDPGRPLGFDADPEARNRDLEEVGAAA